MRQLAAAAEARFGRIDAWVNNAGISVYGDLERIPLDDHRRVFETNYWGVVHGSMIAVREFKAHGGTLVNVGSVLSERAMAFQGPYSATKFAVRALTEGLRAEAPDGVRTTIISPGAVDSELKTHSSDKETSEALLAWYEANQIPADSVARAIAYAIEQPANVDISEVVLRPVAQEF